MPTMRAIVIWQPWASMIIAGVKPFEFRSRSFEAYIDPPAVGDRIAIAAGARKIRPVEVDDLLLKCKSRNGRPTGLHEPAAIEFLEKLKSRRCQGLPLGALIGTVKLGKARNAGTIFTGLPEDSDRGDFNWAWPMSDIEPIVPEIPVRGQQGFFKVTI